MQHVVLRFRLPQPQLHASLLQCGVGQLCTSRLIIGVRSACKHVNFNQVTHVHFACCSFLLMSTVTYAAEFLPVAVASTPAHSERPTAWAAHAVPR
jgi:hypothetical protein